MRFVGIRISSKPQLLLAVPALAPMSPVPTPVDAPGVIPVLAPVAPKRAPTSASPTPWDGSVSPRTDPSFHAHAHRLTPPPPAAGGPRLARCARAQPLPGR